MLLPGTEMHLLTFVFVILETFMFIVQLVFYLSRPEEKTRQWFLILLSLLLIYNISSGFLPDKNIPVPIVIQNIVAYGSGFVMASYFPYYFYKTFGLSRLRFHALYGIFFFLLLPYVIFFMGAYPFNNNLLWTKQYGLIIPFVYSISLVWSMTTAIIAKLRQRKGEKEIGEIIGVYLAVVPWSSLTVVAYFDWGQVIEASITNGGFLVITILYIRKTIRQYRAEYRELQQLNESLSEKVEERAQEIEHLYRQKETTFVNLAHEMKTPLTLIKNNLDEHIQVYGNSPQLSAVQRSVNRMAGRSVQLFDLERHLKGFEVYMHDKVVSLSEMLSDTVMLFKNLYREKKMVMISSIEQGILLKADPDAINTILNNILDNAIKYTDELGVIEIHLKSWGDKLTLSVKDSGIGIPPELHDKIFEPYYQIRGNKSNSQGMGLGLPLVKKVIDSLNGVILVDSDPARKQGTEITIILNRYEPALDDILSNFSNSADFSSSTDPEQVMDSLWDKGKPTILLVEDNREMVHYLSRKLGERYNLVIGLDGSTALEKIRALPQPPDLILSDIMMDGLDGFGFAAAIRGEPQLTHIPFIFLSAKSTPEDKLQGLQSGAIDFISKPFSIQELMTKIDAVLTSVANQKKALLQTALNNFTTIRNNLSEGTGESTPYSFEALCQKYQLTTQEQKVAKLICEGYRYKEIASMLSSADRTVTTHAEHIFKKVQVKSKAALIAKLWK